MKNRHISTFPFLHASNFEKFHLLLPSQQMFHKLCSLKKPGCQKPCWDQPRLSSMVNKQVGQNGLSGITTNTFIQPPHISAHNQPTYNPHHPHGRQEHALHTPPRHEDVLRWVMPVGHVPLILTLTEPVSHVTLSLSLPVTDVFHVFTLALSHWLDWHWKLSDNEADSY